MLLFDLECHKFLCDGHLKKYNELAGTYRHSRISNYKGCYTKIKFQVIYVNY